MQEYVHPHTLTHTETHTHGDDMLKRCLGDRMQPHIMLLCVFVCVRVYTPVCPPLWDMKCNYICPWEHFNRSASASGKLPIQQYRTCTTNNVQVCAV